MHSHDFIADRITDAHPSSSPDVAAQQRLRRLLHALWSGVRQIAWGIDAHSRLSHGIDVPPDHGARSRPAAPPDRS